MTLSHPNITMLFEIGQDANRPYLVFEFVQGQHLGSLITGRALHVRRALEFGINLADALADAHAADMVHGDIRPDTIMITPKDRAKFMNFGLSRFTRGGAARLQSATPYVAPEELAGQTGDSRSDIYSLGAVMFEMLTGRQRARGLVLSGLNTRVPAELEQIIGRMLAANVEHRAQSAAAIAAEFRSVAAILDARTEAEEAAEAADLRRRRREQRRGGLVALVVVLLVLAGCDRVRGGCAGDDHRNARGAALPEKRLRRRLRDDARGDRHRSGRRNRLAAPCRRRVSRCNVRSILLTHAHVDHVTGVPRARQALQVPGVSASRRSVSLRCRSTAGGVLRAAVRRAAAHRSLLRSRGVAVVWRIRDRRAPHAGPLSGRCLSRDRQEGIEEGRSVRRRYAVRGVDWQDRSSGRRSPDADSLDHAGAVCLRRRREGVLGHGPQTTIGQERRTNPFLRAT